MSKKVALLIEDDEIDQQVFSYLLERAEDGDSWEVVTSKYLHEALDLLEVHNPRIVFIDLKLPDELGVNIVRKLKTKTRARLVVLSGTSDPQIAKDSLDSGASRYYSKDAFNAANLSQELAQVPFPIV